jgi:hypothetical protein
MEEEVNGKSEGHFILGVGRDKERYFIMRFPGFALSSFW